MTNAELNTMLYNKMCKEFEAFENELLNKEPIEVLQCAYGYIIRKDILYAIEDNDLTDKECKVLLSEKHPLDSLYSYWLDSDFSYMDEIRDAIRAKAEEILKEKAKTTRRDAR